MGGKAVALPTQRSATPFCQELSKEFRTAYTPSFSADVMTGLARWKKPRERMIFVLCGAAGLRIGEVLGIEIDKHIAPDFLTLYLKQSLL